MCGRYIATKDLKAWRERFRFEAELRALKPRYNLAPSQPAPVVVEEAGRRLELMRWGLVPSWAEDPSVGHRIINARAETLADKPSFRRPLRRRRCLVLADGFYEWPKKKGGPRTPVLYRLKGGAPFAFAGLWDEWRDPEGKELRTFTIVTTAANGLVARIHDRMPAILRPEHEGLWLDPKAGDPQRLLPLLAPYPEARMEAAEASTRVNSPANDEPSVLRPGPRDAQPELL